MVGPGCHYHHVGDFRYGFFRGELLGDGKTAQRPERLFAQIGRWRPDFLLLVGDVVSHGLNCEDWEQWFFAPWLHRKRAWHTAQSLAVPHFPAGRRCRPQAGSARF